MCEDAAGCARWVSRGHDSRARERRGADRGHRQAGAQAAVGGHHRHLLPAWGLGWGRRSPPSPPPRLGGPRRRSRCCSTRRSAGSPWPPEPDFAHPRASSRTRSTLCEDAAGCAKSGGRALGRASPPPRRSVGRGVRGGQLGGESDDRAVAVRGRPQDAQPVVVGHDRGARGALEHEVHVVGVQQARVQRGHQLARQPGGGPRPVAPPSVRTRPTNVAPSTTRWRTTASGDVRLQVAGQLRRRGPAGPRAARPWARRPGCHSPGEASAIATAPALPSPAARSQTSGAARFAGRWRDARRGRFGAAVDGDDRPFGLGHCREWRETEPYAPRRPRRASGRRRAGPACPGLAPWRTPPRTPRQPPPRRRRTGAGRAHGVHLRGVTGSGSSRASLAWVSLRSGSPGGRNRSSPHQRSTRAQYVGATGARQGPRASRRRPGRRWDELGGGPRPGRPAP